MKFYEFNDFEYYALIVAEDVEKAKLGYKEVVADIYEEENELEPNEITLDESLLRYKKGFIEGCETEEDKVKDCYQNISNFKKYINKGTEQYLVLLMDGSLL